MANEEYRLDGYNERNPEYGGDGPYLDGSDFNPKEKFAHAGNPKAAEKVAVKQHEARVEHEQAVAKEQLELLRAKAKGDPEATSAPAGEAAANQAQGGKANTSNQGGSN